MIVRISFNTMYEPGELQPPLFHEESAGRFELPCKPSFKDQIEYEGRTYLVWDVCFRLGTQNSLDIRAIRKVEYREFEESHYN